MRRSDSAAQRGTSISQPTPTPAGSPRLLAFPPGHAQGRQPQGIDAGGVRPMAPSTPTGLRRTALAGRVVVELPVRRDDEQGAGRPARKRRRTPDAAAAVVRLDRRVLALLRGYGSDRRVAGAVQALGLAGEHGAVWMAVGAAGAAADAERRAVWLRATVVVGAAHVLSMGVKRVARRPRPSTPGDAPLVHTAGRHSFPSSHATSSAAAVTAFGALLPGTAAVPVLAAAICVSRLVAGVHYPSDVVCGALLGAVAARLGRTWALGAHHGCTAPGGGSRG
jgi:undecaprenyl-diphosphatase